jgi:16S rRNA G966 N2-methylase RsmD
LESVEEDLETIDLFFLDPPYDIKPEDPSSYESLLIFFDKKNLKADCKIILETKDPERIEKKMPHLNSLSLMTKKAYGDSYLFFIQKS